MLPLKRVLRKCKISNTKKIKWHNRRIKLTLQKALTNNLLVWNKKKTSLPTDYQAPQAANTYASQQVFTLQKCSIKTSPSFRLAT